MALELIIKLLYYDFRKFKFLSYLIYKLSWINRPFYKKLNYNLYKNYRQIFNLKLY
jgi:hypothetical protein